MAREDFKEIEERCKQLLGKMVRVVYLNEHTYVGRLDRVERDAIMVMRDARLIRIEIKDIARIDEYHVFKDDSGNVLEAVVNPETNQIEVHAFYKK